MRPPRSYAFIVFIFCHCSRWPLEVDGANIGENLADFAWNLIGAISRIRRGHDDALDRDDQSAQSALDDPRFLYATLYRFIMRIPIPMNGRIRTHIVTVFSGSYGSQFSIY